MVDIRGAKNIFDVPGRKKVTGKKKDGDILQRTEEANHSTKANL